MKTFDARTRDEWRKWLARHHDSESEVWLIFHKRHTGRTSVAYKDALDEALCYGWIDSLVKRLNDDQYARKFTPRRPTSKWSSINVRRYNELKAANKLAPPGLERGPEGRPVVDGPRMTSVPAYIEKALRADRKAWTVFERLAPSHRRAYLGWIDTAKREETRQNRLEKTVAMLKAGKKLV